MVTSDSRFGQAGVLEAELTRLKESVFTSVNDELQNPLMDMTLEDVTSTTRLVDSVEMHPTVSEQQLRKNTHELMTNCYRLTS